MALLAYEEPENSPLFHYLTDDYRQSVADALNCAVLGVLWVNFVIAWQSTCICSCGSIIKGLSSTFVLNILITGASSFLLVRVAKGRIE